MYERNMENHRGITREADTQEEVREPAADVPGFERTSNIDDKITDDAVLDHCKCQCQLATDHAQWLCDAEVYRDRLVDLLQSKQVVELDPNWSLNEGSFLKGFIGVEIYWADKANVLYVVTGVIRGIRVRQGARVIRLEVCLFVWLYYEGMGPNEALGDEVCL